MYNNEIINVITKPITYNDYKLKFYKFIPYYLFTKFKNYNMLQYIDQYYLNLNQNLKLMKKEFINKIILDLPEDKYWRWYMEIKHDKKIKFKEYRQSIRELKLVKKKYNIIYNWLHRRYFINKSIKIVEYFYRPYNEGYYIALNHFNSLIK